jgi:TolB-like protein
VAVLPLRNISDDPLETDYLAEGIGQAVTARLTQVGLRVTPWETARRYRNPDKSVEHIARELNVDSVLTGTFQISGDQILTTLSLVEAESGFQSWADIIVEPYEDIFQMQLRIATAVASSLKEELSPEDEEALATPESRSADAYDLYLQGAHLMQEGSREAADVALEYFTRAAQLDPGLAEAHVGIGAVHSDRYWFGWGGLKSLDQAEASFERALELNPASMRARRGLMGVHFFRGHMEACLIQGREAARFGRPDDVETLMARAVAYQLGGLRDRARTLYRQVLRIDPANQGARWQVVATSFGVEGGKALEAGEAYLRRFGDDPETHMWMAMDQHVLGHAESAREHYEMATGLGSQQDVMAGFTSGRTLEALLFGGLLYEQLGERDRAEEAWSLGVDLAKPRLEVHPDNMRLRLSLASFYGLLGERVAMLAEEERALEAADFSSWEVHSLAAVHARRGDTERAVELLNRSLRQGFVYPSLKLSFQMAGVPLLESEAFDRFLRDFEAEERRLREMY